MKRGTLTLIIALVLVFLVGGYLLLSKGSGKIPGLQDTQSSQNTTLKSLLASTVSQKCTVKDTSEEGTISTVYVASGKMRGDYVSTRDGKTSTMHTLFMDNFVYMWTDGEKKGFKMEFDPNSPQPTSEGTVGQVSPQEQVDLDKKVDIDCSRWSVDQSFFKLPDGVEFTDFSAMIPATPQVQVEDAPSQTDKCSVCSSLPSDSKTQCLEALGCN